MNPKELVLEALAHREPYRVPVDYWGTKEVDHILCQHFKVSKRDNMLKKLGVDLRYIFPDYKGPKLRKYADGSYEDIWGVRRKNIMTKKGSYEHTVFSPLSSFRILDQLESWSPPSPEWYDYDSLKKKCELYRDYAVVLVGDRTNRTSVLHAAMYLRGVQQALIDIVRNTEFAKRLFDKITDFYFEVNKRCLEAANGGIDILMMGDDMGTQEGLLISPEIFRTFIKPHLSRHAQLARRYNAKVMLHCCGAIRTIIPDLVEIGIDILNPIQVRAKGMNPAELKRDFGDKMSFHGSVDIQKTLPLGTVEDVRAEIRDRVQTLGKGGGFILCSTHNIQADTPLANILAMYDEARKSKP